MPLAVIASSGDGHRTRRRTPVLELSKQINEDLRTARAIKQRNQDYTNSVLYSTSPDAMADMEMGVPTREEQGEMIFQQIRSLMEDGCSQTLTREHAAEIAKYAIKLLS